MEKRSKFYFFIMPFTTVITATPVFSKNSIIETISVSEISTELTLGAIWLGIVLFFIALFGLLFGYNDLIRVLITFEIFFLSNILIFSFVSYYYLYKGGFVFAIVLLAVAAVETAIGLALLIRAHRLYKSIKISDYDKLRAK